MKQCAWCCLHQPENNGRKIKKGWVCFTCLPADVINKMMEKPKQSKQHKNKYAKFSQFDKQQGGGHYVNPNPKKPQGQKFKKHKPKVKKIEYWKVVITDISTGEL